jgi:hypothetical protein
MTVRAKILGYATAWSISSDDSRGVINYCNIFFNEATTHGRYQ